MPRVEQRRLDDPVLTDAPDEQHTAAGPETLAHSEATSLRLTRHQARALALRVHAVIEEFDDDPAAAAAGTQTEEDPDDTATAIYTGLFGIAPVGRKV